MATLECGPGKTYADPAEAYVAGSNGDVIHNYLPMWECSSWLTGKRISVIGKLSNRGAKIRAKTVPFLPYGDLSTWSQMTISDMTIYCVAYGFAALYFNDNSYAGGGCIFENMSVFGGDQGLYNVASANNAVILRNCFFSGCSYGVNTGAQMKIHNCTFHNCFTAGIYGGNLGNEIKNTYIFESVSPWSAMTNATGSNNASDTGSPPGDGPLTISRADAALFMDLQGGVEFDFRPTPGSDLLGAGVAITGLTKDIQGKTRPSPPSIGCSELPNTLEAIPVAENLLANATNLYGQTTTASGTAETHTADQVIDTAGGNYVTVSATKVKNQTAFGISQTGTLIAAEDILTAQVGDGAITVAQALRILLAIAAGKTSGQPAAPAFRDLADTKDVVVGAVDTSGNRTAVTVTP